ncbi:30S ribosomal protein S7 [Candidatus Dependentiae bacterium]|nr:30S ribosomal protein S7 [Candidatus Dependentiae bacterium]
MPRRKKELVKRTIVADPVYQSELITRFINVIMWRGKKNAARHIMYEALEMLVEKTGSKDKALELFYKAYNNVMPLIEVRPRRVGGSVYQIPREVSEVRGRSLALRWLKESAAARSDRTMGIRLGNEILDASEERGGAFKKKLDVHKMAEANRAFSHFAW